MIKRLTKVVLLLPALAIDCVSLFVYGIRWIITGKRFPDPLYWRLLFKW